MILLDTSVVSEPMRSNPDRSVLVWLDAQSVESLYLATVSLSELLLGIEIGRQTPPCPRQCPRRTDHLAVRRADCTLRCRRAEAYAEIVTRARRHGHSIAVADAQIAAIAASRRFGVATRDEAPFRAAAITVINPWIGAPGPEL